METLGNWNAEKSLIQVDQNKISQWIEGHGREEIESTGGFTKENGAEAQETEIKGT